MAKHMVPLPEEGCSPLNWYSMARTMPGFEFDSAQATAIARLENLHQALVKFKKIRGRPFGKTEILGHAVLPQPPLPRGLYLWGGVGRGKSLLMDVFFAGLPYRRKSRMHFHAFMQDVHRQLAEHKGEVDPLAAVAREIASRTRVLCFDEFHVSDIADAMILGRLFGFLFNRGVVMVLTSNYPPEDLYPNGLQRTSFLPTIALLQRTLEVLNLDGGQDHRQRLLTLAPLYLVPLCEENETRLARIFAELAAGREQSRIFDVGGYRLQSRQCAPNVVWFEFAVLCGDQRSQVDYLYIARSFETVLISGIPVLGVSQAAEARRLTWLVDVFYDYRVKLIVSAAAAPALLYTEGEQAAEFLRTVSRLQEMQTQEYLALPHEKTTALVGISET
ncbi:MAG: cell division protein ZapE [Proteobacteria bacterium]|nr:cell division protein ZapE [Pseudomonadota bacterium]